MSYVKKTRKRKIEDNRTLTECELNLIWAVIRRAYLDKNWYFFKKHRFAKLLGIDYEWACYQMGIKGK